MSYDRGLRIALIAMAGAAAVSGAVSSAGCGSSPKRPVTDVTLPEAAVDPAASRAAFREAQAAQAAQDTPRAIELYLSAVRLDEQNVAAWNNLGLLLLEEDRPADGIEALERAAELNHLDARPLENIAYTYYTRGWHSRAHEYYLRALERVPDSLEALRGAFQTNRFDDSPEALDRINRALMVETDEAWRKRFEIEKYRVEQALRADLLDQANIQR